MATPHPASIWVKTTADATVFPALEGDLTTEAVVIGGGFTGLAAAHFLAERNVETSVVEGRDIGWGASGRNGGIVVPRFKSGFASIASRYGAEATLALYRLLLRGVDDIAENVARYGIECDLEGCGHLTPAHGRQGLQALEADAAWLGREAGDTAPRILDAGATSRELGCPGYVGAYLDPRGAGLHPFDYARGLAGGLRNRGVRIFGDTEVVKLRTEGDGVVVETAHGTVRAAQAVIATNAYTPEAHGFSDLSRRIVPVSTSVVATAPLSGDQLKRVLPARRVVSDTRRIMFYYRLLRGNRLLFGGRGDITGRRDDPEIYRPLERSMREFFPALADTPVEARWSGRVAVTLDSLPHVGRVHDRVAFAMGYGGRGVVLTHVLGRALAGLVTDNRTSVGPLSGSFRAIPLHAFRVPGMQIAAAWYRLQDRLGR